MQVISFDSILFLFYHIFSTKKQNKTKHLLVKSPNTILGVNIKKVKKKKETVKKNRKSKNKTKQKRNRKSKKKKKKESKDFHQKFEILGFVTKAITCFTCKP